MYKKAGIALCAALALAACGTSGGQDVDLPQPDVTSGQTVMGGSLYKVQFNEGAKCYVVDSYKSGSLSCDFTNSTASHEGQAGLLEKSDGIQLVRTKDGDICAVYDGYQASGLDCKFH